MRTRSVLADLGLDERRALADHSDGKAVLLEQISICLPAHLERLVGVVEEIDVARGAGGGHQLVQGHPAGDVALAGGDPVIG